MALTDTLFGREVTYRLGTRVVTTPVMCDHCGTVTLALNPVDDPSCRCGCHEARRYDMSRPAKKEKR